MNERIGSFRKMKNDSLKKNKGKNNKEQFKNDERTKLKKYNVPISNQLKGLYT